ELGGRGYNRFGGGFWRNIEIARYVETMRSTSAMACSTRFDVRDAATSIIKFLLGGEKSAPLTTWSGYRDGCENRTWLVSGMPGSRMRSRHASFGCPCRA